MLYKCSVKEMVRIYMVAWLISLLLVCLKMLIHILMCIIVLCLKLEEKQLCDQLPCIKRGKLFI